MDYCVLFKRTHTTAIVSISDNRPSSYSFSHSTDRSIAIEMNANEPPKYKDLMILNNEKQSSTIATESTTQATTTSIQEDNHLPKYEDLRRFSQHIYIVLQIFSKCVYVQILEAKFYRNVDLQEYLLSNQRYKCTILCICTFFLNFKYLFYK